jgi:hypothetical protein
VLISGSGGIGGRPTDAGSGSGALNEVPLGGVTGGGVGISGAAVVGGGETTTGVELSPCGRTVLGLTQSRKSATGAVLHPQTINNKLAIARFMRRVV